MSIDTIINENLADGRLVEFSPRFTPAVRERKLFLTGDLSHEIYRDRQSDRETEEFAKLEANLGAFIGDPNMGPDWWKSFGGRTFLKSKCPQDLFSGALNERYFQK